MKALTVRLGLDTQYVQPAYEDTWYYLWRERRLPVAEAIRISSRGSDSSARIGGDEFGILLPGGGLRGARMVAKRVHELLVEWEDQGKNQINLTASIGVAQATDPAQGVETLLGDADADMYAGRGVPQRAAAAR